MNTLRGVDPRLQYFAEALIYYASYYGFSPRVTSGVRTRTEQTRLYQRYISGGSVLPAAPPGHSKHEYGLAVDIMANSSEGLAWMGRVWKSWGLTWSPTDPVHFEI